MRPQRSSYSETFIDLHERYLPVDGRVLFGGYLPSEAQDRGPLLVDSILARGLRTVRRRLLGVGHREQVDRVIARYLRRSGCEVVLAEYGPTGASMLAPCRLAGIPLVVHFHGYDAYHHRTLAEFGTDYRILLREAAAVVCVSRHMGRQLIRLGVDPARLHYNPYGVDLSMYSGAAPGTSPPVLLAVGRFVEKKAPYLTVVAFARAHGEWPELRLRMVGDGPLLESCRRLSEALGVSGEVEFLGVRTPAEVAALMREARAFVQHSVTAADGDSEGTPVAILEAAASGLPVVSTRHAGIVDAVLDDETGFLVAEGDVGQMGEHMLRLGRDPELAAAMGVRGRAHVARLFSLGDRMASLRTILSDSVLEYRREGLPHGHGMSPDTDRGHP